MKPERTNMHRDWTQDDIVAETAKRQTGKGFFIALSEATTEAFDGGLGWDCGPRWVFRMEQLTIGQIADFFQGRKAKPCVKWRKDLHGHPDAYIEILLDDDATAFRKQFSIEPALMPHSTENEHHNFFNSVG